MQVLGLIPAKEIGFRRKIAPPSIPPASLRLSCCQVEEQAICCCELTGAMPTSQPVTECAPCSTIRFPLQAMTHRDIPLWPGTPGNELFDLDAGTVTQTQVAPSIATWGRVCCKGSCFPPLFPYGPGNRVKSRSLAGIKLYESSRHGYLCSSLAFLDKSAQFPTSGRGKNLTSVPHWGKITTQIWKPLCG